MRLYPYPDPVPAVDAPEGHYEPKDDGGFDFPDTLFSRLHSTHHNGEKRWETAVERQKRTRGEESARRRDPETLYNAVEQIANATRNLAVGQAQPVPADVLAEIAALRAEIAELRGGQQGHPTPAEGTDGDGTDGTDGEDGAQKPARGRRGTGKSAQSE